MCFSCVWVTGSPKKFLETTPPSPAIRIIDLSQDYRLTIETAAGPWIGESPVVYGLPEWQRDKIRKAMHVANPGCFATAIQLGLLPLAKEGWLDEAYTDGHYRLHRGGTIRSRPPRSSVGGPTTFLRIKP